MEKFVMVYGYVKMDNSQLFLDIKEMKKDIKDRGGWLAILFIITGISVFQSFRKDEYFQGIMDYFDMGLRILGMLGILAIFYYLIFKKKSKKNMMINDIQKVEIDKSEFETEVTLQFSSKREVDLNFRNLENQLEPFLEALKKRNTRLIIKKI